MHSIMHPPAIFLLLFSYKYVSFETDTLTGKREEEAACAVSPF